MGGIGSGRHWHWSAKNTVADYRSIDVRRWARRHNQAKDRLGRRLGRLGKQAEGNALANLSSPCRGN